jgi:CubicO group peptidase (beta-lactamase class C family)
MLSLVASCLLAATHSSAPSSLPAEHIALADRYSQSHGGLSLLVLQGDKVLCDDHDQFASDRPHRIFSGTKNFVAITVLIAAQNGLLTLDEPASLTLTEWRHDRRHAITIRQLLNQTSGLDPGADLIGDAHDQMAAAVRVRLIAAPGTRFHYGPSNYQALGEILRRKLARSGESVEDYMHAKVFDPLGIDIAAWAQDNAGHPLMHAGIQLTAPEWAKFGEFILHHGTLHKKQLIDPKLFPSLFAGTHANPAYGLSFWLNRAEHHTQPIRETQPAMDGEQLDSGSSRDIYAAIGSDKQRLYIIPSLDLVIVRFASEAHFSDGDFLSRLLTGKPHPDAHSH